MTSSSLAGVDVGGTFTDFVCFESGKLPVSPQNLRNARAAFHALHQSRYGLSDETRPVEAVTLRLRVRRAAQLPDEIARPEIEHDAISSGEKSVWFADGALRAQLFERDTLKPGARFGGPGLVFQFDTTIVVPPHWTARADGWENLWLERAD